MERLTGDDDNKKLATTDNSRRLSNVADHDRNVDDFATSSARWRSVDTLPLLAHEPRSPVQRRRRQSPPLHLPIDSRHVGDSCWQITSV